MPKINLSRIKDIVSFILGALIGLVFLYAFYVIVLFVL